MRILVTAALDATNLSIENIIKELLHKGHYIEIYVRDMSPNTIRMFTVLNLSVHPITELTENIISQFDIAFSGTDAMYPLRLSNIYTFSYNFCMDTWVSEGADFMFTLVKNRRLRCFEDCATMPIGNSKNDVPKLQQVHNHRFLYIDAGHNPFGKKGKIQVANMLLDICKKFPDYSLVVKPRWLLNNTGKQTHKQLLHIYNVLQEVSENNLPENLILLDEHKNLQELIDDCDCVITTSVSCYPDVLLRGKGCVVVDGLDSEDEVSTRPAFVDAYNDARNAGVCVDYKDVVNFLPNGLEGNAEYIKSRVPYTDGVSTKIVEVMEYVYDNFVKKGKYPRIQEYNYETYRNDIVADPSLNFKELQYKRVKNAMLYRSRYFEWFKADIDFHEYYDLLEEKYHAYPLTPAGFSCLEKEMDSEKKRIILENQEKCMDDAIDQSLLLQNLYDTGHRTEILEIPENKILCKGPYYYYLGMIAHQNRDFSSALYYLHEFLKEANARSFEKYPQEQQWGIKEAYIRVINMYNGSNLTPKEYAELYENLYTKKNPYSIPFRERRIMHNAIPKVCEQLVGTSEEQLALRCLLIRAKEEWRYRGDSEVARIKNSRSYKLGRMITWLPRKLKRGLCCLKENGFKYTVKLAIKKIVKKIIPSEVFQIRRLFKEKILLGFSAYSRIVRKYGANSFIHLSTNSNGDAYLAFRYYEDYISKKYNEYKNIAVSAAGRLFDLSEMFGIKTPVEKVLNEEWKNLIFLYMFMPKIPIDILHHHIFIRYTAILSYLELLHGMNFMEMLDETIFSGLNARRPILTTDMSEIEKLFHENSLQIGKTVMLSPYAQAVKSVSMNYWYSLSKKLLKNGYSVCTSAIGEQVPVEGTVKLGLPFKMMEQFLNTAGYFVSNRSGIDDITHESTCRRVEVYAKENYKRSKLEHHIAECFAYSDNYVIVGDYNIEESVAKTLQMLGIE